MAPRKPKSLRYTVTGPGLDPEPSYDQVGQALSRSVTAAERSEAEGTWYVRDDILGDTLGYSEVVIEDAIRRTLTVLNSKGRKAVGK